jgi:hypothetical protein
MILYDATLAHWFDWVNLIADFIAGLVLIIIGLTRGESGQKIDRGKTIKSRYLTVAFVIIGFGIFNFLIHHK